jgi:hypothetical protein
MWRKRDDFQEFYELRGRGDPPRDQVQEDEQFMVGGLKVWFWLRSG